MDKDFLRRMLKLAAELGAVGLTVVLLQLFINWIGFDSAWPYLAALLLGLIVIITWLRKE